MPRLLLQVEALEDRSVPSVFTVTSRLDDGAAGTFRWAIVQANNSPNSLNDFDAPDQVHFNLPGPAPFLLELNSRLPAITEPVIVDGFSQPTSFAATSYYYTGPVIFLDGPMPQDPASKANATLLGFATNDNRVFPGPVDIAVVVNIPVADVSITNFQPRFRPRLPDPSFFVPLRPKKQDDPRPQMPLLDQFYFGNGVADDEPPAPAKLAEQAWRVGGTGPGLFLPGHEQLTGKILGQLFEDYDGNALKGQDEAAMAGRVVYLDLNHNGRFDSEGEPSAVTNEKGEYRFEDLRPGTYTVKQLLQPHLVQTLPPRGEGNQVDLQAGETVMEVDFGAVRVQKRRVQVDSGSESQAQPESGPRSDAGPGAPDQNVPATAASLIALGWGMRPQQKDRERKKD